MQCTLLTIWHVSLLYGRYLPATQHKGVSYAVRLEREKTDLERSCTLVIHDRVGKPWHECGAEELIDGRIQEREHGKAPPLEPVVDDHACGPRVSILYKEMCTDGKNARFKVHIPMNFDFGCGPKRMKST